MLANNERFKKEYKQFSEKISMIPDEKIKTEMNQLLQKLLSEVRSIDNYHHELINGNKLATDSISTQRSSLSSIRQQLIKKIESCEKSGLIKSR
jgi:hypothetical protein